MIGKPGQAFPKQNLPKTKMAAENVLYRQVSFLHSYFFSSIFNVASTKLYFMTVHSLSVIIIDVYAVYITIIFNILILYIQEKKKKKKNQIETGIQRENLMLDLWKQC